MEQRYNAESVCTRCRRKATAIYDTADETGLCDTCWANVTFAHIDGGPDA